MGAASVSHAITLSGSTVNFTFDETGLGLFSGAYSVSGDTLSFTPSAFISNGSDTFFVSQTINVTVTPKSGWQFSNLNFSESGLYTYTQVPGFDDVYVTGQLRIFNPANPGVEFTPSIDPALVPNVTNATWNEVINQNISALASAPSVNVTIENLLYAYDDTTVPTDNQISKNLASLSIVTTPVPEVETWAMMLAGLGLVGLQLRRRTSSSARIIR